MSYNLIIRQLGLQPYKLVLLAMQNFTNYRTSMSVDEIWLVQHQPVFTQGRNGKAEYLPISSNIPIVHSDRGGQITFHGPGQQILYVMLNLHRRKLKIRDLITLLEQVVITTLSNLSINSHLCKNAPGVYINNEKICSLGLHIKQGCSFHGLALNIAMDLTPFLEINPCGYSGLRMTQISNFIPDIKLEDVTQILIIEFLNIFKINIWNILPWNINDYLYVTTHC